MEKIFSDWDKLVGSKLIRSAIESAASPGTGYENYLKALGYGQYSAPLGRMFVETNQNNSAEMLLKISDVISKAKGISTDEARQEALKIYRGYPQFAQTGKIASAGDFATTRGNPNDYHAQVTKDLVDDLGEEYLDDCSDEEIAELIYDRTGEKPTDEDVDDVRDCLREMADPMALDAAKDCNTEENKENINSSEDGSEGTEDMSELASAAIASAKEGNMDKMVDFIASCNEKKINPKNVFKKIQSSKAPEASSLLDADLLEV